MDEDHHSSHHPSESIPNAAYPDDSAYRPGQGHLRPNLHPQANSFSSAPGILSPQATYQSSGRSYSYTQESQGFSSSTWTGQELSTSPSSPPPPYDPNNVPVAFTPLGTSQTSISSRNHCSEDQRQHFRDEEAIPLHTLSPVARPAPPSRLPSRADLSHTNSATEPLREEVSSSSATVFEVHSRRESYNKLGPLEAARRRKKRKAKICLILLSLAVVFLLAVVLGVALSALKRKPHHNDPYHDANPQTQGQGQP